ncbi:ATP-binding protein [Paenibacillus sp. NPDC058071]|uniref:HAMP domain-containing sensor histidine kinase n=1 Tax=Paenibacillus sp. NPDC058071 TaxID=3346326 RepID=UPI0036DA987E
MERINRMSLKQAFFCLSALFMLTALLLSLATILGISEIIGHYGPSFELKIPGDQADSANQVIPEPAYPFWYHLVSLLQIALPVLYVISGLFCANWLFYRLKLKRPLADLQNGAERIIHNDLDFSISSSAKDELGQLCNAFEAMRIELLKSNKELWRQAEERKRLNAAFSHDLRNPITVMKGSIKLLKKEAIDHKLTTAEFNDPLSLLEEYSHRIEAYIDTMSSTQRLEEINCKPAEVQWSTMIHELTDSLAILSLDKELIVHDNSNFQRRTIQIDKFIVYNVAENLVSNAIRYAHSQVHVAVTCDSSHLILSIQDNGAGYPLHILREGPKPFSRGEDSSTASVHFGMGLYICQLLCEKHGGSLTLHNQNNGALATASFSILKP